MLKMTSVLLLRMKASMNDEKPHKCRVYMHVCMWYGEGAQASCLMQSVYFEVDFSYLWHVQLFLKIGKN